MVDESDAAELARGEVDADADFLHPGAIALPFLELAAGLAESPVSDRENETVSFGLGYEFHGGDEAAGGMLPANESFESYDAACDDVHFRLVEEDEMFLVESGAEVFRAGPCDGGECGVCGRGVGLGESVAGAVEGSSGTEAAKLQLVGDETGETGEDGEIFGAHLPAGLVSADAEDADDLSVAREDWDTSEESEVEGAGELRVDRSGSFAFEVEDDEGGFFSDDALGEGVEAREFPKVSAVDGFGPDASFVDEGERCSVGLETLGGDAGDGVVTLLFGCVEDGQIAQGGEPLSFPLPFPG